MNGQVLEKTVTVHVCSTTVTVTDLDDEAPIVFCQNIIVSLNNFEATVPVSILDAFVSDNCSSNLTFTVNGESTLFFYCDDLGFNTVTLDVTDENGNVGSCTSTIEVQDPLGNCSGPEPCLAPTNLQNAFLTDHVLISWDPPAGSEACQITGGVVGGGQVSIIKYAPNVFEHYVPNNILDPNADYQWRVRCACELDPLDVSPFSPYAFFNLSTPLNEPQEEINEYNEDDLKTLVLEESNLDIYPNPNDGNVLEVLLTDIDLENVQLKVNVLDLQSRSVHFEKITVFGSKPTYSIEFQRRTSCWILFYIY